MLVIYKCIYRVGQKNGYSSYVYIQGRPKVGLQFIYIHTGWAKSRVTVHIYIHTGWANSRATVHIYIHIYFEIYTFTSQCRPFIT